MEVATSRLRFHPGNSRLADRFSDIPHNRRIPNAMKRSDWKKDYRARDNGGASPCRSGSSSHSKREATVQARVAIEIIYGEGPRRDEIRDVDKNSSRIRTTWVTLRQEITRDFHAIGLSCPPQESFHILEDGHIFACWSNDKVSKFSTSEILISNLLTHQHLLKSHILQSLQKRLQTDGARDAFSKRNM